MKKYIIFKDNTPWGEPFDGFMDADKAVMSFIKGREVMEGCDPHSLYTFSNKNPHIKRGKAVTAGYWEVSDRNKKGSHPTLEILRVIVPERVDELDDYLIFRNEEEGELMWETYGDDLEQVRSRASEHPLTVATVVDTDGGLYLLQGMHLVNRLGYVFFTHPVWLGEDGMRWCDEPARPVQYHCDEDMEVTLYQEDERIAQFPYDPNSEYSLTEYIEVMLGDIPVSYSHLVELVEHKVIFSYEVVLLAKNDEDALEKFSDLDLQQLDQEVGAGNILHHEYRDVVEVLNKRK